MEYLFTTFINECKMPISVADHALNLFPQDVSKLWYGRKGQFSMT